MREIERKKKTIRIQRNQSQLRHYKVQRSITQIKPGWGQEIAKPWAKPGLLNEGTASAPESEISMYKGMNLPSKKPKWPAPKSSNVTTNVPGHPEGSLKMDTSSGLVSFLGQWLYLSDLSKYCIIFFTYLGRKKPGRQLAASLVLSWPGAGF